VIGEPGTGDARPGPAGPGEPAAAGEDERPIQAGFERFLSMTRLLALIPVLFLLFDAAASFIYGTDIMVRSVTGLISEPAQVGGRLGVFLVVMDTFLVGATLMVAAFGFYELFVVRTPRHRYRLPRWLRMNDLEDLKARVVSMLILVAAITFVDRTVESQDEQEVLFLGIGISIIIVALTFFLWLGKRNGLTAGPEPVAVTSGGGSDGGGNGGPADGGPASGGNAREASGGRARGPDGAAAGDIAGTTLRNAPRRGLRLATAGDAPAGDAGADRQTAWQPSAASDRPRRLTAILGVARRDADWSTSPASAIAVAGYARLDLRDTDLAEQELTIRATAVFGVVSITVPPDTRVAESGVAVLGMRLGLTGAARPSVTAGRRLAASGLSVFGVVRVRCRPRALAQMTGQPPSAPATVVNPVAADEATPGDNPAPAHSATAGNGRL
jgi:uncharacterized membrane protein YqhA